MDDIILYFGIGSADIFRLGDILTGVFLDG